MRVHSLPLLLALSLQAAPPSKEAVEFFEKEVRPLLAAKCHSCHHSKSKTKFAGLALDTEAAARKGGDSGPVIAPGRPAESKLIRAVKGELAARMPPGGALTAPQIASLEKWIEMGASWPAEKSAEPGAKIESFDLQKRRREHWAWQPVRAVSPPPTKNTAWPAEPIDRFLLARMEREGIAPSGDAGRRVWLRRLSFDLTGLPPTPAELDAFDRDTSADAYRSQVDRVLQSPRFGEHWARHWMDLVRYAESHGSEGDPDTPEAWRYRDYIIRALNADIPYDQILREHLAGDLLPAPRIDAKERVNESILGTANLRMVEHGFQPVDPWEDRIKWTDNQIDVFAKAFQGLTVSCARCHDHKVDAISQRDYYALFGIFASARPTQAPIDPPEDLARHREPMTRSAREVQSAMARRWKADAKALPARLATPGFRADFEGKACDRDGALYPWSRLGDKQGAEFRTEWDKIAAARAKSREAIRRHNAGRLAKVWDLTGPDFDGWIVRGANVSVKPSAAGAFSLPPSGPAIAAIYPAGVYTHLLSNKHNGVITSPRFRIDTDHISMRLLGGNLSFAQLIIENYAVPRGGIYGLRFAPKKDEMGWWTWDATFWKGFTGYIEFATHDDVTHFALDDDSNRQAVKPSRPRDGRSWIGASAVAFHDAKGSPKEEWSPVDAVLEGGAPASFPDLTARYARLVESAVDAWTSGSITGEQARWLDSLMKSGVLSNNSPEAETALAEYRRLEAEVPTPRRAPAVLEEGGAAQRLLIRGNHKSPGPEVPRRYLEAFGGPLYDDPKTARLRLADAVADPSNPLTARVMVNRVWRYMFGAGLVRSVDNFGKLGDPPSHPELLDWLADRFMRDGWSIKAMVRMVANSRAYRLSSVASSEAAARDPLNRLLSHAEVKRLEAEAIRDSILAVSGQLDPAMYGESVDTYYAHDTGKTKGDKPKGPLDGKGRRSVYLEVRRNVTNPFLEVFDLPKASTTRGERDLTNVPAQSLAFLNSPFVIDQAAKWAKSLEGDSRERIGAMFLRALGRQPDANERDRANGFLAVLREEHGSAKDAEEVAWRDFAQALFNLKEFVYIR